LFSTYGYGLIPVLMFLVYIGLIGLGVYIAVLLIKALNIYIKKNS
jgi:hypothetical protein